MPITFDPIHLEHDINNYKLLGSLKAGQKLTCSSDKRFSISTGDSTGFFSRILQAAARTLTSCFSKSKANRSDIAEELISLNQRTAANLQTLKLRIQNLNSEEDVQQICKKITEIEQALQQAETGLLDAAKSYKDAKTQRSFLDTVEMIRGLQEFHLKPLKHQLMQKPGVGAFITKMRNNEKIVENFKTHFHPYIAIYSHLFDQETLQEATRCFQTCATPSVDQSAELLKQAQLRAILSTLNQRLQANPHYFSSDVRKFITQLIVFTSINLVNNNDPSQVLSPQRLVDLLTQLASKPQTTFTSFDFKTFFHPTATIYQKLYDISLLNIENRMLVQQIRMSDLHIAMRKLAYLPFFLQGNKTHAPQYYRQTCKGECFNYHMQNRSGTIVELLQMGRSIVNFARNRLSQLPLEKRNTPAYVTHTGKAPTLAQYTNDKIHQVEEQFNEIQRRLTSLLSNGSDTTEIENLVKNWNFSMQTLESVIDPNQTMVLNTQIIPSHYNISAVASALGTGMTSIIPSQPTVAARWTHDVSQNALRELNSAIFNQSKSKILGGEIYGYNLKEAIEMNQMNMDTLWDEIYFHGGGYFNLSASQQGGSGHATFLKAQIDDRGQKTFTWSDPMHAVLQVLSSDQLREQINQRRCYIYVLEKN